MLSKNIAEAGTSILSHGALVSQISYMPGKHNGTAKNVRNFKCLYQNPNIESEKARQMCDKFRLGDGSSREML